MTYVHVTWRKSTNNTWHIVYDDKTDQGVCAKSLNEKMVGDSVIDELPAGRICKHCMRSWESALTVERVNHLKAAAQAKAGLVSGA